MPSCWLKTCWKLVDEDVVVDPNVVAVTDNDDGDEEEIDEEDGDEDEEDCEDAIETVAVVGIVDLRSGTAGGAGLCPCCPPPAESPSFMFDASKNIKGKSQIKRMA